SCPGKGLISAFLGIRSTMHQEIVAPCRRDLECPTRQFLALDIGEIIAALDGQRLLRARPGRDLAAGEMIDQRKKALNGDDFNILARPSRLGSARHRADDPLALTIGGDGSGQYA